ncbi:hypothetical protein ABPG73_015874 [Tetrahymena malaccensis]
MSSQFQYGLIKKILNNLQLKYVLRQYKDITIQLNKDKKKWLDELDDEATHYKYKTRQITFDDYCMAIKTYSKEMLEVLNKNHQNISKYNMIQLYNIQGSQNSQRFEYLLLQKLSEHIGDMSLNEIIKCLSKLKVYDQKVIKFQFDLLSERIMEQILYMTNEQLVKIIFHFGKFDQGTEELWKELTHILLFRINDFSKEDILSIIKGYSGSNRGNQLFWQQIFTYFNKHCDSLKDQVDFDIVWILMKTKIENEDFWVFVNLNYSSLIKQCETNPENFYKFFKYSIQNIMQISQVNQIELFDILALYKDQLSPIYQMKIMNILSKNQLLTPKISEAFQISQNQFSTPNHKLLN